jgi:hypothetical protein
LEAGGNAVDAATLDRVLAAKLFNEASTGLTEIATELCGLYNRWVEAGADAEALAWLYGLLERLGFWAGRMEYAADPALIALFPTLD